MNKQIFTVTQINRYIRHLMEDDALLSALFVIGELSNVKPHSSGHLYFTLKDETAAINGVMFKSHAQMLPFVPANGMKIVAGGYVSLYEKTGQYQFYAEYMEPAGIGGLQAAFMQMRDKLQGEGLFAPERKKPIPAYANCVAVVTSPTGAAVRDIIRVIRERNTAVKIVVVPALVQGEGAAADIARAISEVNAWAQADVMIVGRGGGSAEDLWAFNEEVTVRAVAGSRIPVISAVGHETDTTLTDFAADLRAPTPTAAAAAAVYGQVELRGYAAMLTDTLNKRVKNLVTDKKTHFNLLYKSRVFQKPLEAVYQRQLYTQSLLKTLNRLAGERLAREQAALSTHTAVLEKVSPYAVWSRGYALVYDGIGAVVTSVRPLAVGLPLEMRFKDGTARAAVTGVTVDKETIKQR